MARRIARNVGGTLRVLLPPGAVTGTPTVEVTRVLDGATVVASTNAAADDPAGTDTAGKRYRTELIPAQADTLGELKAVWTATVAGVAGRQVETRHEVVGGHVIELGDLRALEPLDDTAKFTDPQLEAARDLATEELEKRCRVAFTRRRRKDTAAGYMPGRLVKLNYARGVTILSGSIDSNALDADNLAALRVGDGGLVSRAYGWGDRYELTYEHGYQAAPLEAGEAVAQIARYVLEQRRDRGVSQRATSFDTDNGSYRLVTAGVFGAAFSLPEVNSFVQAYRE